ncbi:hypothetical protein BS50DRAFT_575748 [Corynespora cassiicola Philippines]|uniref:Uncharacterized protein n=1 Tax=Corynespora cassiicola Philippines TaxID=1448308 RepID=A0A2T2NGZ0_CORCC|nr:hypothetical protein BS50DRAFT_575748 [Corynespora cassiicola Philippines]
MPRPDPRRNDDHYNHDDDRLRQMNRGPVLLSAVYIRLWFLLLCIILSLERLRLDCLRLVEVQEPAYGKL